MQGLGSAHALRSGDHGAGVPSQMIWPRVGLLTCGDQFSWDVEMLGIAGDVVPGERMPDAVSADLVGFAVSN